jgi:hypothetical protein
MKDFKTLNEVNPMNVTLMRLYKFLPLPIFFSVLISGMGIHAIAQEKPAKQVAVLVFQNLTPDNSEQDFLKEQIPAIIESRLRREKLIQLQDRRHLNKILKEWELAQTGIIKEGASLEITRLLQADYLIHGEFKSQSETHIIFRLTDAKSGKVAFIGDVKGEGTTLLRKLEMASGMAAAEILGFRSSFLTVRASVIDSDVFLDGNFIGKSPIVAYPVTKGKHEIIVQSDYFVPAKKNIQISENQTLEEYLNLYFKGYEINVNRLYVNYIGMTLGSDISLEDKAGMQFGYDRFFNHFLVGIFFQKSYYKRTTDLEIFNHKTYDVRKYQRIFSGVKVGYHFLIHPAFLALCPGISVGYMYLRDDLEGANKGGPPYEVRHGFFQAGIHLGLDFFPGFPLGLVLDIQYLPAPRALSYKGEFNPYGFKKFSEEKINISEVAFAMGIRYSFSFQGPKWQ